VENQAAQNCKPLRYQHLEHINPKPQAAHQSPEDLATAQQLRLAPPPLLHFDASANRLKHLLV